MRDILRCNGFAAPFGSVYPTLTEYVGLPALSPTEHRLPPRFCYVQVHLVHLLHIVDLGTILNSTWYPTLHVAETMTTGMSFLAMSLHCRQIPRPTQVLYGGIVPQFAVSSTP